MITSTTGGQNATKTTIIVVLDRCPAPFCRTMGDVKVAFAVSRPWQILRSCSAGESYSGCIESPARLFGLGSRGRALLAGLSGPRPQQGAALASLVVEQVRVDRGV